jgi:hypothetical protein
MFLHQQSLSLAVTPLLPQIGRDREAPMMPHHRPWHEAKLPARISQPPTNVNIVACGREWRAKAADL